GEVSRVALDPVLGAAATRQGFGACLMGRFSPCLGSVQPDARGTTRDAERAAPGRLSAMTARGSGARTAIGPVWRSDSGAQVADLPDRGLVIMRRQEWAAPPNVPKSSARQAQSQRDGDRM